MEPTWDEWISANLARGCDPDELVGEMVSKGFARDDARRSLERAVANVPMHDEAGPYLPTAIPLHTDRAELYGVDGFLDGAECAHLVALIREYLRPSTTSEEGVSGFRTSRTCDMADLDDPVVREVDRRLCAWIGIDPAFGEPLQGQWYDAGQQFKPHTDYFDPDSPDFAGNVGGRGQRSWTVMVYLNGTREGGATRFPRLDVEVGPQAGSALAWNNRDRLGRENPATLHHGTPVTAGYKAILTKWFRSATPRTVFAKEPAELRPPLTRDGFLKTRTPPALHERLVAHYRARRDRSADESIPEFIASDAERVPSVLIELPAGLRTQVHVALQPVLEAWIGDYLHPTWVYGIREYRHGAVLRSHRDREGTHVASAILNVAQDVRDDWPLEIEDHHYRRHRIVLAPGDMLLYEGARLLHGRCPDPLDGERFANVFAHFRIAERPRG